MKEYFNSLPQFGYHKDLKDRDIVIGFDLFCQAPQEKRTCPIYVGDFKLNYNTISP